MILLLLIVILGWKENKYYGSFLVEGVSRVIIFFLLKIFKSDILFRMFLSYLVSLLLW